MKIAETSFLAGADDKLAAVDTYKQSTAANPLSVYLDSSTIDPGQLQSLAGMSAVDEATQLANIAKTTALPLKPENVISGFINRDSQIQSAFSSLDPGLQKFLTGVKGGAKIRIVDGKLKTDFKLSSMANVAGVKTMINVMGGKKGLIDSIDVASKINFTSNLLKVAAKMGVPNAYSTIAENIKDNEVLNAVTRNILPSVIVTSNTNMLSNISFSVKNGRVKCVMPKFTAKFAANFKLPAGILPGELGNLGATISGSFSRINGRWVTSVNTKGRVRINANTLLNVSSDFRKVMGAANTKSRSSWKVNASANQSFSGANVPVYRRPGLIKYETVTATGRPVVRYKFANGSQREYETNDDGILTERRTEPEAIPTNSSAFTNFDNSKIEDPLVFGHILNTAKDRLAAGKQTTSLFGNPIESLKSNFPYTIAQGVSVMDDEFMG